MGSRWQLSLPFSCHCKEKWKLSGSPSWGKWAIIPWSRQVLHHILEAQPQWALSQKSTSRKSPTAQLPKWIKIKMKALVFLTHCLAASPLCFRKKKNFYWTTSTYLPAIQLNENTLASTLNCYFGNPEKSCISKYSKISGHPVTSQNPKQIKTTYSQIHEPQWTPSIINMKKTIWNRNIINCSKPMVNRKS